MPYSHHSHSGQFCPGHARNTLEEMIQSAIAKKLLIFAVSEHMPRHDIDLYPEERETGWNLDKHFLNEDAFYAEASRLREKYRSQIQILIGFEAEWIRHETSTLVQRSLLAHDYDFFIGSVHHVHTIPIDYSAEEYYNAKKAAGGTDLKLFANYFDWQFEMLQALHPPIVGHFDLIRLKSWNPNGSFDEHPNVWRKILRNLDFIHTYGGILEINSSALRKGMVEPYPKHQICAAFHQKGGKFCLSDDSHGVDEVVSNYDNLLPFLTSIGITELYYFQRAPPGQQQQTWTNAKAISVEALKDHPAWAKWRADDGDDVSGSQNDATEVD